MQYEGISKATFLVRPNRFIAEVLLDDKVEICHVKNTGRMGELLFPGVTVYVQKAANPNRRTAYTLIAAEKGERVINIDSTAPNQIFREWLEKTGYFGETTLVRPETVFGSSRLDFYLETARERIFVEVKGVTLEREDRAYFPDAPTERGVKHLYELIEAKQQGYRAAAAFIVKMEDISSFSPNEETHPAFGEALRAAKAAGVELLAIGCRVTPDSVIAEDLIEVIL